MVPGIEQRHFESFDGTVIGYQIRGPESAPAVVFANGLGGTFEAYRYLYEVLGNNYRTVCWDYRGLASSSRPTDLRTLDVPYQCDDIALLMDREKIDRAVFCGWSMGVQVNFELFRRRRDRMAGIVAINGTYGRPFNSALASRYMRHVVPSVLKLLRARARLVGAAAGHVVDWDGMVPLVQRVGLASRSLDVDAFRDVAETFKSLDWECYTEMMERLGEHDARDVLPEIDIPTLIITGDTDYLTPVFTAEKLHRAIRGSRMVVIKGGTHYTPLEFPSVIQEELLRFLARITGFVPPALSVSARRAAGG